MQLSSTAAACWCVWLHLCVGQAVQPVTRVPAGVVDPTAPPFSADPTGGRDATRALQSAMDHAARTRGTLRIPAGRYRVTDTLNCTIDWEFLLPNGTDPGPPTPSWLYAAYVVVGQRPPAGWDPSAARPTTLWLPPATPGFTSRNVSRPVVHFYHTGVATLAQPDININQILQSVDVSIGEGNAGAVGVMHLGAQGSSLEDVTVWAGDAAAGVVGGAGGGGSHSNVRVVGGRFGMDLRAAQPAPTVTGAVLVNQSCAAVIYQGRGPLTMVGAVMEMNARPSGDSVGLVASGLSAHSFTGDCTAPVFPFHVYDEHPIFGGSLSIVDSVLSTSFPVTRPAVATNHSVFVRNCFFKGFSNLLEAGVFRLAGLWPASRWSHVPEYAAAQQPQPYHYTDREDNRSYLFQFTSSAYSMGTRAPASLPWMPSPVAATLPPRDLRSRHLWDEAAFPSFQSPSGVNAIVDCHAKGDGVADDHGPLQRCLDAHAVVVLPRGYYRLSRTLVMSRDGSALVGIGRTSSILMAASEWAGGQAPLLRVEGNGSVVFQLSYVTFWHLPSTWLLDWRATAGFWRQSHGYRTCDLLSVVPQPKVGPQCVGFPSGPLSRATKLDIPLSIISGGGGFYSFYVEDWKYQSPGYRHLLVNNSVSGARLYHANPDCARGDAGIEVANSVGVSVFGMKAEGNYPVFWVRSSRSVLFTGFGGFASPFPADQAYPAGYQPYTPSMTRLENSTDVTLANLWGSCRIGGHLHHFGGVGYNPARWSFLVWKNDTAATRAGFVLPPLERPTVFVV